MHEKEDEDPRIMDDEVWVEWILRVTDVANDQMTKARVEDWVQGQRRRKWRLAGHMARREDGRWSTRLLQWEPGQGVRKVGGQRARWGDSVDDFMRSQLDGYAKDLWMMMAQERSQWREYEDAYVKWITTQHRRGG